MQSGKSFKRLAALGCLAMSLSSTSQDRDRDNTEPSCLPFFLPTLRKNEALHAPSLPHVPTHQVEPDSSTNDSISDVFSSSNLATTNGQLPSLLPDQIHIAAEPSFALRTEKVLNVVKTHSATLTPEDGQQQHQASLYTSHLRQRAQDSADIHQNQPPDVAQPCESTYLHAHCQYPNHASDERNDIQDMSESEEGELHLDEITLATRDGATFTPPPEQFSGSSGAFGTEEEEVDDASDTSSDLDHSALAFSSQENTYLTQTAAWIMDSSDIPYTDIRMSPSVSTTWPQQGEPEPEDWDELDLDGLDLDDLDLNDQDHEEEIAPEIGPSTASAAAPLLPMHLSNPNPTIAGSSNFTVMGFLRYWARDSINSGTYPPVADSVLQQTETRMRRVQSSDLNGDFCDLQGLDWVGMQTFREAARAKRRLTYRNYVNRNRSDFWMPHLDDANVSSCESFFRFKKMSLQRDTFIAHFQLRNTLASPSRFHAFYPSPQGINRINTVSQQTDVIMNLREFPTLGGAVSALDAGFGVLMCGTSSGDYYLQSLNAENSKGFIEGQISNDVLGITNHIKLHRSRISGQPIAAIASNDRCLRVMDLQTEKFTSCMRYPFALNCSAISPDGRLRALVGDDLNIMITHADTGEILEDLRGHRDYVFACDWSDDGWTVATGSQDKGVKIWDARKWRDSRGISAPLCTIMSEQASVRSLRFSPGGSGRPILVAAEEADYINIIDAKTFASKQTVDFFGEIGGTAFSDDGQSLNVLCCDPHRGGLLQFDRCHPGSEPFLEDLWSSRTKSLRPEYSRLLDSHDPL